MLQQVLQSFAQLQNRMDISEKFNLIRRDLDMIRHDIDSSRSIGGNKSLIGTSAIDKSVIDTSLIGKSLIGKTSIGNNSSSDEVSSKVVVPSCNVSTQTAAVSIRSVCTQTLERGVMLERGVLKSGDESKETSNEPKSNVLSETQHVVSKLNATSNVSTSNVSTSNVSTSNVSTSNVSTSNNIECFNIECFNIECFNIECFKRVLR